MAAKDKYEVTVDGETETVKNKTEVKKTIMETLADGEAHTVEVDEVVPEPKVKDKAEDDAPTEGGVNIGPGTEALGIPHVR